MGLFVERSIEIDAPAKKVWKALTHPVLTRQWVNNFGMEGGHLESDWKVGSAVEWRDKHGKTYVTGTVTKLEQHRHLHYTVRDLADRSNVPEFEGDGLDFRLEEQNNRTTLHVRQGDFSRDPSWVQYHEPTNQIWLKVLPLIKSIAEHE